MRKLFKRLSSGSNRKQRSDELCLPNLEYNQSNIRDGMIKIELPKDVSYDTAYQARKAAEEVFIKAGYIKTGYGQP